MECDNIKRSVVMHNIGEQHLGTLRSLFLKSVYTAWKFSKP